MGTEVQVLPGTVELAEQLAPLLRAGDVAEAHALGVEPREALIGSVRVSETCFAVLFDGELAAMFGVRPVQRTLLGRRDLLWMLSGQVCDRYPRLFMRTSRDLVDALLLEHDELFNVIDARYTGALRWARWLGAEVGPPAPLPPHGLLFCPFTFRSH